MQLEIDKICSHFDRFAAVPMEGESVVLRGGDVEELNAEAERLGKTGHETVTIERQRWNRKALEIVFASLHADIPALQEKIARTIAGGSPPLESIFVTLGYDMEKKIGAALGDATFTECMRLTDDLFDKREGETLQGLRMTIQHGIGMILDFQKLAVASYERKHGKKPDEAAAAGLIPKSTDRMMKRLTKVPVWFTNMVERHMGLNYMQHIIPGYRFMQPYFYAGNFVLRDTPEGDVLDVTEDVTENVMKQKMLKIPYTGCVATHTTIEGKNLFGTIHRLLIDLTKKHWVPTIVQKRSSKNRPGERAV